MDKNVFIVIPTYNEAENIEDLIKEIISLNIPNLNIIVVDDNSSDGTGVKIDELAKHLPVFPIHRQGKLGLGSAYIKGFKFAIEKRADLIFEMVPFSLKFIISRLNALKEKGSITVTMLDRYDPPLEKWYSTVEDA